MRILRPRSDRLQIGLHGEMHSLAKPLNDLLGVRAEDTYLAWLARTWSSLAPTEPVETRELLAKVAEDVSGRNGATIDYVRLAPLLSKVRHWPAAKEIEVDTLEVLAAWALVHVLERGELHLKMCGHCGRPFFATPSKGHVYCERPAPGLTMTCAQLRAHERFTVEREEWGREYRKVMARKRRGTITEVDFRAWKAMSKPGVRGVHWRPYDEWKQAKAEPIVFLVAEAAAADGIELTNEEGVSDGE